MSGIKIPDAGGDSITLLKVDGHLYPKSPVDSQVDAIRGIRDLPVREDDVFICAYPKCGTHWVWEMVRLLLLEDTETVIRKEKLMLEFFGKDVLENFPSPRVLNTHCLVEQLPRGVFEKKCKIIYILRNPKDMAVSFFHHHTKLPKIYEYDGKWENHLSLLMDGKVDFGSFFTYLKDWAAVGKTHPEVPTLTLVYEDLKEDPLAGIRKVAKFLNVEKSEEFYLKVKELTSFNKMKERKGGLVATPDGSPVMYRKGEVGDWKNYFTVAQNEAFDRLYKENMAGCDINFRYTLKFLHNLSDLCDVCEISMTNNKKDDESGVKMSLIKIPDAGGESITYLKVDGHLFARASVDSQADVIRGIRDLPVREDDVYICAYPKCVDSGSFTTYLKDWAAIGTNHPEVPTLTLVYEDLKEDPLAGIRKLAKFLNAEKSEEFYLKVKELTSFNKMKEKKGSLVTAPDGSPVMYRKGEVGDWKNYFTVAQNEAFDRLYMENMAGCDINFRYSLK
ncbi:sulfotransferase 1C2-like [Haliotis rubra]|uniref:sulfotransferase 1C2-like n=1 Tax=Haliotis rubra TaxID=36100 RepID=UPI001EE5DED9|nr:sulfotransferase 1C2-like [Haliotis rubra]